MVALGLLVTVPAAAESGDSAGDSYDLGGVTVTESRDRTEAAQTVSEITAEEIKSSSARTLDEALILLPDVNVRVGPEGVPRVEIRGFRTRHVLLLLDGVPLNSAFDQQFDPSLIPVDRIARIKVTAGASSVLYGQGGLGGVINIITKKGEPGLRGMVGAETGDGEPILGKASLSGARGRWDGLLTGNAYRRDRFPLASPFAASLEERDGYRKNSDNSRYNAFGNLGYSPAPDLYLALTGIFTGGGYGKPASAINSEIDPYAPEPRFGRVDNYLNYFFQLAADWAPVDAFGLRAVVYVNRLDEDNNQYDDETYSTFDDPNVPNSFKLRNTGIARGIAFKPRVRLGRAGDVTFGLLGEWDTWMDAGLVKTGDHAPAQGGHGIPGSGYPYTLYPVQDDENLTLASAAIEYEVSPIDKLGIVVGYARHWQLRRDKKTAEYGISASAAYDVFAGTRLKAAFQRNIRFPSLAQLYLRDADNPDLKTERVNHYQLGFEQKLPWRSTLRVDGFHSDAHDFIAKDENVPPGAPPKYRNYSLYRFYGAEAELETKVLPRLVARAGYAYLHTRDFSDSGMEELQYVPRDKATLSARYEFDFGLTPFVSILYSGNSYVYTKGRVRPVQKAKMADYAVVNLKVSQRLWKDRLFLYVGADNLFNVNYEQSYGIPRPGRFLFGGAELHLDAG
jgi:vitamin B12 transporter